MPIAPTPPSAVPDFPAMGDATFNTKAYNWAVHMDTTYPTEMLALADNSYDNAVESASSASTSTTKAAEAAASAVLADASADAAALTASAAMWVSGQSYALGENAISPTDFQTHRRIIAGAGTTDPALDIVNWTVLGASPIIDSPIEVEFETTATMANGAVIGILMRVFNLDANREFIDFRNGHCAVYNRNTKVLGAIASYRATSAIQTLACVVDANTVIVASCTSTSTAFEAVGITISGETCTVGTPATATLAGNLSGALGAFIPVGTSYIISYGRATNVKGLRAMTISGSTVTLGAETAITGASTYPAILEEHSASLLVTFSDNAGTTVYATPYTVSGTSLSVGTEATVVLTSGSMAYRIGGKLSGGRYFVGSNGASLAAMCTITGTVASWSSTVSMGAPSSGGHSAIFKSGDQVLVAHNSTGSSPTSFYVLTDSAGTPSASTSAGPSGGVVPSASGFTIIGAGGLGRALVTISGTSVKIEHVANTIPLDTIKVPIVGLVDRFGLPANTNCNGLVNGTKIASTTTDIPTGTNRSLSYYNNGSVDYVTVPPTTFAYRFTAVSNNGQAAWTTYLPDSTVTTANKLVRIGLP